MHFMKRDDPVVDVFQRQREQHRVHRIPGEPVEGVAGVVDAEVRLRDALAAELHHARALVEPGHSCAAVDQLLGVEPGTAGSIQEPQPGDVAKKVQTGRA